VLFSTGGAAIKLAAISPAQVASFRSGIAGIALYFYLSRTRGRARVGRKTFLLALLVGVVYAATMLLYVGANRSTTAANTVFLQGSAPLYLLLLAPLLLHERWRRSDLFVLVVMAAGLAVFFLDPGRPQETAPAPLRGNLMAAAAGLTWALTVLGLRWFGRSDGPTLLPVALGNGLAFALALPFALPVVHLGLTDAGVLVWLGVFQIALAYVCTARGLRAVSALEASLLFLLEPALNPIWAWAIHGEVPGRWALVGGVLILGAGVFTAVRKPRKPQD